MTQKHHRKWTVLVYTMADEPALRKAANGTLEQIASTQARDDIKIAMQVTLSAKSPNQSDIRLFDFESASTFCSTGIKTDRLNHLRYTPEPNLNPKANLTRFLHWGATTYPAQHYCVVLQGHAWGADYRMPSLSVQSSGTSPRVIHQRCRLIFGNPASKNRLTNKELALAIGASGYKFDILGLDSCLMCMVEICYQLRHCARYLIAPEGYGPIRGWPFNRILSSLTSHPQILPEDFGRHILTEYSRTYFTFDGNIRLTISLCDLRHAEQLVKAMRSLVTTLIHSMKSNELFRDQIIKIRNHSAHYGLPAYVDLREFCQQLRQAVSDNATRIKCTNVIDAISRRFIVKYALTRHRKNSFGLSIYFPNWQIGRHNRVNPNVRYGRFHFVVATPQSFAIAETDIREAYTEHDFADTTNWMRFLILFLRSREVKANHTKTSQGT